MSITIGLSGPPYAGKTEIARYLEKSYGAWVFGGSAALRRILEKLTRFPRPFIRDDYSEFSTALREEIGDEYIFTAFLVSRARESPKGQLSVHDGIRWPSVVAAHRFEDGFHLIWLEAPLDVRFQRALTFAHGKGGRPPIRDLEAFMRDEMLASELELPQVREMLGPDDAVIDTNEPLEATLGRIDTLMLRWLPARA